MKRREQSKHASPDGLASGPIEPAVSASGTICLAADIERPQRSWVPPTPASLDQEVEAMVRRASPFPAPPAGHAMTFTVPVSFQLR
jgi:hypothetical protein